MVWRLKLLNFQAMTQLGADAGGKAKRSHEDKRKNPSRGFAKRPLSWELRGLLPAVGMGQAELRAGLEALPHAGIRMRRMRRAPMPCPHHVGLVPCPSSPPLPPLVRGRDLPGAGSGAVHKPSTPRWTQSIL